jgi:hypothetical protein
VSRKSVPKEKGGIPLDELLAAHATGSDARLDRLVERYGRDVVPASSKLAPATSSTVPKPATTPTKQPKTSSKRAPEARLTGTMTPRWPKRGRRGWSATHAFRRMNKQRRLRTPVSRARGSGLAAAVSDRMSTRPDWLNAAFGLHDDSSREGRERGESPNHVARVLRVGRSTLYRHIG